MVTSWVSGTAAFAAVEEVPGASLEVIPVAERSVAAGLTCAKSIVRRRQENRPDGLFCANDLLAIGVVQLLSGGTEIRIPADMAVVGYDDVEFARSTIIPITTIHTPDADLGATATRLLFQEIDRLHHPERNATDLLQIEFPPRLVVRASSIGADA